MSTVNDSGIPQLVEHIGNLYLNKEFSDVKIVVDNVELPAHRVILAQRSSYFKAMFTSGMIESTSKRIELRETPINGFKTILKWIYTGVIEFDGISDALEVLDLAHMYQLLKLEQITVDFLEGICNVGNVCMILNSALRLWLEDLSEHVQSFLSNNLHDILADETVVSLSNDALGFVLEESMYYATNIQILKALVRWMKTNYDKSDHFNKLLKLISLNSISLDELLSIVPSDLISGNDLIEVAREQQRINQNGIADFNVVRPGYGVKVIHGDGASDFFGTCSDKGLRHAIGDGSDGIVIDLGQRVLLNCLKLSPKVKKRYAFEVSVSIDSIDWTLVVCRQRDCWNHVFFFDKHIVRFLRIRATAPVDDTFEITLLHATYG